MGMITPHFDTVKPWVSVLKGRKVYLSGPMTGIPDFNFPFFERVESWLKESGALPVSPHRVPTQKTWEDYLKVDINLLLGCEAIMLLPGWKRSQGALLERAIAASLGLDCFQVAEKDDKLFLLPGSANHQIAISCDTRKISIRGKR
jgi:hypothetical protein